MGKILCILYNHSASSQCMCILKPIKSLQTGVCGNLIIIIGCNWNYSTFTYLTYYLIFVRTVNIFLVILSGSAYYKHTIYLSFPALCQETMRVFSSQAVNQGCVTLTMKVHIQHYTTTIHVFELRFQYPIFWFKS